MSLHNFRIPGSHIIRRPVYIHSYDDGLWTFMSEGANYCLEMYDSTGEYVMCYSHYEPWYTELPILLKGDNTI